MKAELKWIDGLRFVSVGDSRHSIVMDSSTSGENSTGPSPTELFLQALAACTAMDVISILQKMREPVEAFEMRVEGKRADEYPKVIEYVKLEYIVYGNVNPENLDKAINLSQEKYCNISITLKRAGAKIDIIRTIKQRN